MDWVDLIFGLVEGGMKIADRVTRERMKHIHAGHVRIVDLRTKRKERKENTPRKG